MKYLFFLVALFSITSIFSQEKGAITGHIIDKETIGEGLLFAQVALKDTDLTAQTNFHGNFEMSQVEPGNYIMTVSYLGYEPLEIPLEVKANQIVHVEEGLYAKTIPAPGTVSTADAVAKL